MNRRELLESAGAISLLSACNGLAASRPSGPDTAFDVQLRIGPGQSGVGNHRWARILGGTMTGSLLSGVVGPGRFDWHVDPASGAVDLTLSCGVRDVAGRVLELRDRSVHCRTDAVAPVPGLPTAPALIDAADARARVTAVSLAGRLDVAEFARGSVRLRAFRV
jgi:hypothetical protein